MVKNVKVVILIEFRVELFFIFFIIHTFICFYSFYIFVNTYLFHNIQGSKLNIKKNSL